jgi:hypothetical protein
MTPDQPLYCEKSWRRRRELNPGTGLEGHASHRPVRMAEMKVASIIARGVPVA